MSNFISKTLEDSNGNKSSKRLAGFGLIGVGLLIGIITWIISLYHPAEQFNFTIKLMEVLIIPGCCTLGTTVFEGVFSKLRKKS